MKNTMWESIEGVLNSDTIDVDRIFVTILLAFVVIMLAMTFNYSDEGRLMPLIVGVPTFALLVLLLAYKTSSRFSQRVEGLTYGDVFDLDDKIEDISDHLDESDEKAPEDRIEARKRVVLIISWIVAAFGLIYLAGFLVGLFVFLIAFYRIQAHQSRSLTVVYSLVAWTFIYIIFRVVLNAPLYQGVLGIDLVGILTRLFG